MAGAGVRLSSVSTRRSSSRGLERLLQVVVGAVLLLHVGREAPAGVHGGDQDHGDVAEALAGLELAADLEAVHLGQHAVQDHEVGHGLAHLGQGLAAGCAR